MTFGDTIRSSSKDYSKEWLTIGGEWDNLWSSHIYSLVKINPNSLSYTWKREKSFRGVGGTADVLWGLAGDTIHELNPNNGNTIRTESAPGSGFGGIGGDENTIWLARHDSYRIYELSTDDFSTIRSSGLTWPPRGCGGKSNIIWITGEADLKRLAVSDFSVLKSGGSVHPDNQHGVGGDKDNLWCVVGAIDADWFQRREIDPGVYTGYSTPKGNPLSWTWDIIEYGSGDKCPRGNPTSWEWDDPTDGGSEKTIQGSPTSSNWSSE